MESAAVIGTDLHIPRIAFRQHPAETPCDFWKRSIFIPYLDSLISVLNFAVLLEKADNILSSNQKTYTNFFGTVLHHEQCREVLLYTAV
ncbi:unnamed protein product [Chilo suppressalis]|uniref:Uncharacterized protein n=1 Tax=Chilo suppressalis TaxID=168631 RepID=A0ABN8AWM6_CHISP|nr:unnamed protein product [Chilo suppressalis]